MEEWLNESKLKSMDQKQNQNSSEQKGFQCSPSNPKYYILLLRFLTLVLFEIKIDTSFTFPTSSSNTTPIISWIIRIH